MLKLSKVRQINERESVDYKGHAEKREEANGHKEI